jgi:HTH-type transcriptional regulator/antitoxin MqsA
MLNRLKARSEGLLEPEAIRRIRKKLRLTQELAGRVVGGGPRAFQKYECGDLLPSRAISSALILLDHNPVALAVLKARHCNGGESLSYSTTNQGNNRSVAF